MCNTQFNYLKKIITPDGREVGIDFVHKYIEGATRLVETRKDSRLEVSLPHRASRQYLGDACEYPGLYCSPVGSQFIMNEFTHAWALDQARAEILAHPRLKLVVPIVRVVMALFFQLYRAHYEQALAMHVQVTCSAAGEWNDQVHCE